MTIVCGDSHTSTHGAFGALAFGIGTSEVEHVLATQTLLQARPKTMAVTVNGSLPDGVTAKDLILALIAQIGTGGGQGYIVEYRGQAIEELSMEGRMTVCNMSIEGGAKAGMIAPDQTTFDYLEGTPDAPKGADWDAAVAYWKTLVTDDDADLRRGGRPRRRHADAVRHLGHQPRPGRAAGRRGARPGGLRERERPGRGGQGAGVHGPRRPARRCARSTSTPSSSAPAPTAASRTSGSRPRSSRATPSPTAPGCSSCRARCGCACRPRPRAWTRSSSAAGAEWRGAGCSMCLGMNPDQLAPGERSASTSNRNFEGRQGKGGRTHLVSLPVAAATAVAGHLASPADLPAPV